MMDVPAHAAMPARADGAQPPEQRTATPASDIQQTLEKTHADARDGIGHTGPLKKIIANQESLYKYISWESPLRTLGSYIGAMGILFGAHHLPLTQWALKAGATILGVASITELASRLFGPVTICTRLRPIKYGEVPEPTLDATLKDIHDLIQFVAVQAQRLLFCEDLGKTFAAFLALSGLYWLTQAYPPFWLSVQALTLVFIIPLVFSPKGRAVAHHVKVHAGELADAAADGGKSLAQDGKAQVAYLSSKAREAAADGERRVGDVAQSGKQTIADRLASVRDAISDISGATAEKVMKLGGADPARRVPPDDMPDSASSGAKDVSEHTGSATETAKDASPDDRHAAK